MTMTENESVMNIGTNCSQCNTIDFLPFKCEYCNLVFCADHRKLVDHQCPGLLVQSSRPRSSSPTGPSAASLFPDRDQDRIKINQLLDNRKPIEPTLKHQNPSAMMKITKFLHLQKLKREKKSTVGKIFSSSSVKKTNPIIELQSLKKIAKGDGKIKLDDRIYVWCVYLKHEDFEKIDIVNERKGLFINKNWSIGRNLDYISDQLSIINKNNHTNDSSQRLNIFKIVHDAPQLLNNAHKGKDIKHGETLYLVRGL